ncbi:phosphotransferase enzyme family protein [Yinghuangia sp. YIM S09857]|uniref:phosphotransferase enzyme family protein n=1 Tax=Yinghuangia sp. YIM S09857 TaxID=3436929 RepID=UPI003F53A76A
MARDLTPEAAFTVEHARAILPDVCADAGLSAEGAVLLRFGENAVFRLAEPVVVRVARSAGLLAEAERSVRVAEWLEGADYPAVRVSPGIRQPVAAAGRVVTFWGAVGEEERFVNAGQLGELLARLHALEIPVGLGLPRLDPLADTLRRLSALSAFGRSDLAFLAARAEELQARYEELEFVLPAAVVHGDAHVGNGLLDADGRPVLIDLDGFAVGPREWDLVVPALYADRVGWHTEAEYEAFVQAYGFNVMNWDGYPVLADIRELDMVVWLAQNVGHSADVAAEVARRIADLRGGAGRRGWRAF